MKLLLETCLDSYLVALINDDQVIDYVFEEKLKHKSDALDNDVREILNKNKITPKDLSDIYVTEGPGSFMGVRAGLIYGYTLAKALNIRFLTSSSLDFLSGGRMGEYFIDAKSGQAYYKKVPNGKIILKTSSNNSSFDLQDFLKNTKNYLDLFNVKNTLKANYVKEPKVN